jgi:hypothetical protein
MRAALLVAALLVLSACGKNDQTDNMQNVDDNLSADSIVSNDVTAIDAVTGDAANMAADVDMNYGNLDAGPADTALNEGSAKPSRPAPKKPATAAPTTNSAATTTANTATNAE